MKEAIPQLLGRVEDAEHIRRDTLERWARYKATGRTVSHEDVDEWLKTWETGREGQCPAL
jgi:predicted transcriptional regulator